MFFFISLLTYFCYLILKGRKAIMILDKGKYNLKKCKKQILIKENFVNLELLGIFLVIMAFFQDSKITGICAIILYMILSLLELRKSGGKFKFTSSNIKVIITTIIIYLIIFGLILLDYIYNQTGFIVFDHTGFYYLIAVIAGYLDYLIIILSCYINNLIKRIIKKITKKSKKGKKPAKS